MLHDQLAGAEGFTSVLTDAEHQEITALLRCLAGVKIHEYPTLGSNFNGGDALPSAEGVTEAFLIRSDIHPCRHQCRIG